MLDPDPRGVTNERRHKESALQGLSHQLAACSTGRSHYEDSLRGPPGAGTGVPAAVR